MDEETKTDADSKLAQASRMKEAASAESSARDRIRGYLRALGIDGKESDDIAGEAIRRAFESQTGAAAPSNSFRAMREVLVERNLYPCPKSNSDGGNGCEPGRRSLESERPVCKPLPSRALFAAPPLNRAPMVPEEINRSPWHGVRARRSKAKEKTE